ncbi:hypothetical protein F5882DRAFT_440306 [Hyaloscypha sp. PMI_1271]|nr:hypothetical protein F5882DRAFT_440306 [Hyaloscypha sp. PMI_1271]
MKAWKWKDQLDSCQDGPSRAIRRKRLWKLGEELTPVIRVHPSRHMSYQLTEATRRPSDLQSLRRPRSAEIDLEHLCHTLVSADDPRRLLTAIGIPIVGWRGKNSAMAEQQVFSFLHPALMTTSWQCHSLTRSFSQQAINDTTTYRSQEPAVPPARSVARHPTDHKLLSIEVLARNSKVHSFLGPILQVSLNLVLDIEKILSTTERVWVQHAGKKQQSVFTPRTHSPS